MMIYMSAYYTAIVLNIPSFHYHRPYHAPLETLLCLGWWDHSLTISPPTSGCCFFISPQAPLPWPAP